MTLNPMDVAISLFQDGRAVEAQEVLVREVRRVEERSGAGSPEWAAAQSDLGNLLLNCGQAQQAAECFQAACSGPVPADWEARKDRITFRMNLGIALQEAGRFAEAEAELRQCVQERLSFYGREHPGYAFGLEPLAEVLLRQGDLAQAREVVEEAVANLWNSGHERVTHALALRAEILAAGGVTDDLFAPLEALPDPMVEQVGGEVLGRAQRAEPQVASSLVAQLATTSEQRLGPDAPVTVNAWSTLANLGRATGDHAGRLEAIRRVLASFDRQGAADAAVSAVLGLALAYGDAGDGDAALNTYADASARAERLGRPELIAQTLRNWGLALAEADRTAEAEQRLTEAVTQARRGSDDALLGRSLIALGLFLQHHDRLAEAQPVTEEGLSLLDPIEPDALMGRNHLNAMVENRSCGCGDMAVTMADAFRQYVLAQLPPGLLKDLDVTIADDDFQINVELQREPTEDELQTLNRVVQAAHAELRRRLSRT